MLFQSSWLSLYREILIQYVRTPGLVSSAEGADRNRTGTCRTESPGRLLSDRPSPQSCSRKRGPVSHLRGRRLCRPRSILNRSNGGIRFTGNRPIHINDVRQTLDLHDAVDAQLGSRALAAMAQARTRRHPPFHCGGRIDTDHPAWNNAVAGIDRGVQPRTHILHLCFRNLQNGL